MKLKVKIIDQNNLELLEDGKVGDIIDLSSIINVDTSKILDAIKKQKDVEYERLLAQERSKMEEAKENSLKAIVLEKEKAWNEELHKLELKLKEQSLDSIAKAKEYEALVKEKDNIISDLKNNAKRDLDLALLKTKEEIALKYQDEILELKNINNDLLVEKERLTYQKASVNVKLIGESLEKYCNREALSYMENGLFNCTWQKDNKAEKEDDESQGTKGDFIFKIYQDETHLEPALTSVCLEMKDESPTSKNKKKEKEYFKRLNENRNKKQLQYAVLVSNLETETEANPPIYRVKEYPDMYVVRPNYMMVFLNLLTSLTLKFAKILKEKALHELKLKTKLEFEAEFNKLKITYFEKPLEQMAKELQLVLKNATKIKDLAIEIEDAINKIIDDTIDNMKEKIAKFEIEMHKQYKKRGKIDEEIN